MVYLTGPHAFNNIRKYFRSLQAEGLWRERRVLSGPQGVVVNISNQEVVNFSSNDYLGLANHPTLIRATSEGVSKYGVGSGASQLVCGYSKAHQRLEEKICEHTGRERALLFSSGYLANLAIATTLAGKGEQVVGDRLNHASMIDAGLLSRAHFRRYRHADIDSLQHILSTSDKHALVMTDAVFSMDGDIAPLPSMVDICRKHGALLAVDDAHGFGVLGNQGAGTLSHFNLASTDVPLLMATFGKALGTSGAFIAGDALLIEYLLQTARSLIYTTAPPPAFAHATVAALDLLQTESWRNDMLLSNIDRFRRGAAERQLPVKTSTTAIQPLLLHDPEHTVSVSTNLLKRGFLVAAIRPPTVPIGSSRLRIVLSANHTETQIIQLLDHLADLI